MAKKLNDRNTKREILDQYDAVCKQLEELANSQADPKVAVKEKEKKEVTKVVKEVQAYDFEKFLANLNNEITSFKDVLGKVSEIKKAQELEEAELDELFGIKANAFSLVALENTQKLLEEEHKAKLEAEKQAFEDEKQAYEDQKKEDEAERQKNIKREKADWEYDFKKKQKVEDDKLADELKEKEKKAKEELEIKEAEYNKKLEDLEEREAKADVKDTEIADLKTKLETVEAETVEKTKKKLQESNDYAIKFVKQDKDQKISLLEKELEYLRKDLTDKETKVTSLEEKLDKAYTEMKVMATTSVEAGASRDMANRLENLVKNSPNGK